MPLRRLLATLKTRQSELHWQLENRAINEEGNPRDRSDVLVELQDVDRQIDALESVLNPESRPNTDQLETLSRIVLGDGRIGYDGMHTELIRLRKRVDTMYIMLMFSIGSNVAMMLAGLWYLVAYAPSN